MDQISLYERKKMRNSLILKVYLFTTLVVFPFAILQEFFFLPMMIPSSSLNANFFQQIHQYFLKHYIYVTYGLLTFIMIFSLYIFCRPYVHYIMTGENKEKIKKKIIYPFYMLADFLIVPNICNFINLILDFKYISSLPRETVIYFFIFKIIWQFLACFLTIFYFFTVSRKMRETLGLHSFEETEISFFANNKNVIFIILEFAFLILIILQTIFLNDNTENSIQYIIIWGLCTIGAVVFLINILIVYQNTVDKKIRIRMYQDIKDFVEHGTLTKQHTYYERNSLGTFVSEYNLFANDIYQGIDQITQGTHTLNDTQNILKQHSEELITTISQQEINVSQMNIAINTTSTTVQNLLAELHKKVSILDEEKKQMTHLVTSTDNLCEIFQSIVLEHKTSQISNRKAFKAVEKSLEKTALMNQQIETIHQRIHATGLETSAIDEVLGIIKNISEQTNLLSMSAAIEAAHGDASSRKGFTLVAEEIRKLAQMSQDSVNKISTRLSTIKEHISDAYSMSKESIEISSSSLKIGGQLKESIAKISKISDELSTITQQVEPITNKQQKAVLEFQDVIHNMLEFLNILKEELKNSSTSAVMMSLSFRTMIQNFKQGRISLYHIESSIEQLNFIKNQLNYVLEDFHLDTNTNKE